MQINERKWGKMSRERTKRQQLPREITQIEVEDRRTGRMVTRYWLRCDAGENPVTGKRQQVSRRYCTEREARDALAEVKGASAQGTFVPQRATTTREVCECYVRGRHNLRATSLSKLAYDLAPLIERHGDMPVQRLTKAHIDTLVTDLRAGGTTTANGRKRKPWQPISVNKFIQTVKMILADARHQGLVVRNVAEHVDTVAVGHKRIDTYTESEVETFLVAVADDRLGHVWELGLSGLRRGELGGLKWNDLVLDGDSPTLSVQNNRVSAGGVSVENDPKSMASRRTLPLPPRLVAVLKSAKARQAAERLALGPRGGDWEYVASNEAGYCYNPAVLSRYWADAVKAAGLRHIRLHDARHTAATTMHLHGVPVAVIAAWIGHKDASLTMRLYAHSQPDALKAAGVIFDRVVSTS